MRLMKDSGIEWIEEIPESWDSIKIKRISNISSGGTPKSTNDNYYSDNGTPWVTIGDLTKGDFVIDTEKKLSDEGIISKNLKVFEVGTILYSIYATIGKVSELKVPATINQAILAISVNDAVDKRFFKYSLNSIEDFVKSNTNDNTQFNLSAAKVNNLKLPIPPLDCQHKIVDFLYNRELKINCCVKNLTFSIEKLKEYKRSIITEAVTKGLDPDVSMKDSGIEWIGDIPEHWKLVKVKEKFTVVNGATPSTKNSAYWDGEVIWITPADLNGDNKYVSRGRKNITKEGLDSLGDRLVPANSIIVSNRAPIGLMKISSTELCTNQGCKSLVSKGDVIVDYCYYFLLVQAEVLNHLGRGTTFMELSSSDLQNFYCPSPTMEEQNQITKYLEKKVLAVNELINKKEYLIERLLSYKNSIVYEAVTGKIEV